MQKKRIPISFLCYIFSIFIQEFLSRNENNYHDVLCNLGFIHLLTLLLLITIAMHTKVWKIN